MKISVNWLKDFVDINISTEELAEKLVSCGFEIEEIIQLKDNIKNVVVGKIIEIEKHTQADNLLICKIDIGKQTVQVVTNANNVQVGNLVPLAIVGGEVFSKKITPGTFRGVESNGMLCGGEELGLTEEDYKGAGVNGILILGNEAKLGQDINEVIGNDDIILDISITANRPDANSVLGIAREISAVTGCKLKEPDLSYDEVKADVSQYVSIENIAYDKCPRYMGKVVKDIKVSASPDIIRKRLKAVGLRSINNIVDITNYVLIEVGQPMHAFDLAKLEGQKIIIRRAEENEEIIALDEETYKLKTDDLVICDENSPVAIAGIMGGLLSAVSAETKSIVFESARFKRDTVRHTSKRLNLRSDSSHRFERGIDFESQEIGLKRALHLISKYNFGTIVSGSLDLVKDDLSERTLTFTPSDINKILGIEVPADKMLEILNSLQIKSKSVGDEIQCIIPRFREDLEGNNDIAEEIIRIYGYDKITPTLIEKGATKKGGKTQKQKFMDKIKNILMGKSANEIVTYSFFSPKSFDKLLLAKDDKLREAIEIANPIGEDFSVMRTTLAYSMIAMLASNYAKGNKAVRLFEVAKTYIPKSLPLDELPYEMDTLSLGLYGIEEDFYSLKGIIEDLLDALCIEATFNASQINYLHPTRTAIILDKRGNKIGYLGEVKDDVMQGFDFAERAYIAEIDAEYLLSNAQALRPFKATSKYPAMERDIAVNVDRKVNASEILAVINSYKGELMENATIFDVYTGSQIDESKKSVAIKMMFRHLERTLNEKEVSKVIDDILLDLDKSLGAKLR